MNNPPVATKGTSRIETLQSQISWLLDQLQLDDSDIVIPGQRNSDIPSPLAVKAFGLVKELGELVDKEIDSIVGGVRS